MLMFCLRFSSGISSFEDTIFSAWYTPFDDYTLQFIS